jgi:hypothetical protein
MNLSLSFWRVEPPLRGCAQQHSAHSNDNHCIVNYRYAPIAVIFVQGIVSHKTVKVLSSLFLDWVSADPPSRARVVEWEGSLRQQ